MIQMKKLLFAFFLITLGIQAQDYKIENTLLWKISGKGMAPSYLYGTMHVRDERAFDFSDSVLLAFGSCKAFAMEVHPDSMNQYLFGNLQKKFNRTASGLDEETFKKELGEDYYNQLNERLQKESGIELKHLKNKNPKYIRSLLSETEHTENDKHVFLDLYLYDLAGGENKKIYGLENITETYDKINKGKGSLGEQIKMEIDALDKVKSWTNLIDLYKANNLTAIHQLFHNPETFDQAYRKILLDDRNIIMANSIDSIAPFTSCFFAVGSGHLPGEFGIIELLRKKGYTVTPVIAIKTNKHLEYPLKFSPIQYQTINDEKAGYSIEMGSIPYNISYPSIETDMYVSHVLTKGIVFCSWGINGGANLEAQNEKELFDRMIDQMVSKRGGKVLKQEKIVLAGQSAMKIETKSSNIFMHVIIQKRKSMVYLLMLGSEKKEQADLHINRYLNSFKIIEQKEKIAGNYISTQDAFSVNFPGTPKITNIPSEEGDKVKMTLYVSSNSTTNSTFLIKSVQYTQDYKQQSDSLCLAVSIEELGNLLAGYKSYNERNITFEGYPAKEIYFTKGKETAKVICVMRTFRIYFIMCSYQNGNEDEATKFYDSFKLIDYQEPNLKEISLNSGQISFLFPENYVTDTIKYTYNGLVQKIQYTGKDFNSSNIYFAYYSKYSKIYSTTDSTFLEKFKQYELDDSDDTLVSSKINKTTYGYEGDFTYHSKSTQTYIDVRRTLVNNELFSLIAYRNTLDEKNEKFLNSFNFKYTDFSKGILKDTKTDLIKELRKPTLATNEIRDAIRAYSWKNEDIKVLIDATKINYNDDSTSSYNTVNGAIFDVLEELDSVQVENELIKNVKQLVASSKFHSMYFLAGIKTEKAANELAELMLSDTSFYSKSYNLYSVFERIDNSNSHAKILYPKIVNLLNNASFIKEGSFHFVKALDSSWLHKNEISPYKNIIFKNIEQEMEYSLKAKETEEYFYVPYWLNSAIKLWYQCKDSSINYDEKLMNYATTFDDDYFTYQVVSTLLVNQRVVRADLLKKVCESKNYLASLYFDLAAKNLVHLMPKKYAKPQIVAESDMYDYAYNYMEMYPSKVEFISLEKTTHEGIVYEVYTFKITEQYDKEKYEYFGISGLYIPGKFNEGKKKSCTNILYDSYKDIKSYGTEALIQRCISEASNY